MRALTRPQFLALPAGVFYWKHSDRVLSMKAENAGDNDWYALELAGIEPNLDHAEISVQLDAIERCMIETGARAPMAESIGRDALYDEDEIFFVLDRPDLERLQQRVTEALAAISGTVVDTQTGTAIAKWADGRDGIVAEVRP